MEKTIKVKFRQLSSGVTATTSYEASGENLKKEDVLEEAYDLHDKATTLAEQETMKEL